MLAPFEELKVCVAYEDESGKRYDHVPYHQSVIHKVRPVYETLPGWNCEIDSVLEVADLPAAAQHYIQFIEQFLKVPVTFVGVGPARDQTVVLPVAG